MEALLGNGLKQPNWVSITVVNLFIGSGLKQDASPGRQQTASFMKPVDSTVAFTQAP